MPEEHAEARPQPEGAHYIIRGGDSGTRRLHILARAFRPGTLALLDRLALCPGMRVLDLGCGSGDVTLELARRVGPQGQVTGIDMDESVLQHARSSPAAENLPIQWRNGHAEQLADPGQYDLIYARFLLSHLANPGEVLLRMVAALRPGGLIVIEDIDITSHSHWPPSHAFQRYIEIYSATARAHGADSSIGPRLPALLVDAGFDDVQVTISMPVFRVGEGKSIARITLENIADAAIAGGFSTRQEIDVLLQELAWHEADPRSIQTAAQAFQCVGRRPE
jgi:SAM-dependent methyltransferase